MSIHKLPHASSSVSPFTSHVSLEIVHSDEGLWLEAAHRFRAFGAGSHQQVVVVDVADCALPFEEFRCTASTQPVYDNGQVHCRLAPGMEWDEAVVSYRAGLTRGLDDVSVATLFPAGLPRIVGEDARPRQQTIIRLIYEELVEQGHDLRIVSDPWARQADTTALAIVYLHGESVAHQTAGGYRVCCTDRAMRLLERTKAFPHVVLAADQVLSWLAEWFGVNASGGIAFALEGEVANYADESGLVLTLNDAYLDAYPPGSPAFMTDLTRRAAAQWWGTACRVAGVPGRNACWALCGALSVVVAREIDTLHASRLEAELLRLAGWRPADLLRRRGRLRRSVSSMALAFLQQLQRPAAKDALRTMTRQWWSTIGSIEQFHEEFGVHT